jgi:hypothetical protein
MRSARRSVARWAAPCALVLAAMAATSLGSDPRAATTRATSPGVSIYVAPVKVQGFTGTPRVCVAPGDRCTDLTAVREVPIGRYVNARSGAVVVGPNLEPADPTRVDAKTSAIVFGATFRLEQEATTDAVLVARLAGGAFRKTCGTLPPPSSAPLKRSKTLPQRSSRVVRALSADTIIGLRIVGGYASATTPSPIRETTGMRVEDRCAGTRVASTSRAAIVATDLRQGTSVAVSRAKPFAAQAPPLTGVPGISNAMERVSLKGYSGEVKVCKKRDRDCQTLTGQTLVPIGSHVDASDGGARLSTTLANGDAASTIAYGGEFQLLQRKQVGARLDLKLEGASFKKTCGRAGLVRRGVLDAVVQALRSKGRGRTRTRSRDVDASVKGTAYAIEARCTRTVVRVFSGTVNVFDRVRGRTVAVSAPHSYAVKRRGS